MQTTITPLREPDLERSPQPPANVEAEQALLGAILINNAAHGRVAEFLLPEHFGNAVHGRIYAAISRLIERGQMVRPIGPIHFAGEHTAGEWAGLMEGALRSGRRGAAEVLASARG